MKLSQIKPNDKNPRLIKDAKFEKLKQSIKDFPKMMELRPIIIDDANVILGGNMRYRALKALEYKEIPDNWVLKASELTEEQKQRFIISDNVGFGEWDWDILANEWEVSELEEWGLDLPFADGTENKNDYSDKNKEIDTDEFSDKMQLTFELTSDEYQFIQSELSKINASKEIALLTLLKYES